MLFYEICWVHRNLLFNLFIWRVYFRVLDFLRCIFLMIRETTFLSISITWDVFQLFLFWWFNQNFTHNWIRRYLLLREGQLWITESYLFDNIKFFCQYVIYILMVYFKSYVPQWGCLNPLATNFPHHIKICYANQSTGSYMIETLTFSRLRRLKCVPT